MNNTAVVVFIKTYPGTIRFRKSTSNAQPINTNRLIEITMNAENNGGVIRPIGDVVFTDSGCALIENIRYSTYSLRSAYDLL